MGLPHIILVTLSLVSLLQASRYTMSEVEQDIKITDQGAAECAAGDDVEMSSQLTDAPESIEIDEQICSGGEGEDGGEGSGGEKGGGAEQGEKDDQTECGKNSDEGKQAIQQDSQQEVTQVEDSQQEVTQVDSSQQKAATQIEENQTETVVCQTEMSQSPESQTEMSQSELSPTKSQSPEAKELAEGMEVEGAEAAADNQETMSQSEDVSREGVDEEPKAKPTSSGSREEGEPKAKSTSPSSREEVDKEPKAKSTSPSSREEVGDEPKAKPTSPSGRDEEPKAKSTSPSGSEEVDEEPKAKPTFPKTLKEFGYHFNKEGQLRSIEGDQPFVFEAKKGDKKYNQARYEALGEVITEEVYARLESDGELKRHYVPVKRKKNEPQSFIFASRDALSNKDKLMLLIHGSGVVRAGQWARSLIINDCLDSGTQLPYIKRAMAEGYGVIVFNTNNNRAEPEGTLIRENGSPKEHAQYVWKHFVKKAKAKRIYIVAHSYGGVVTVDLASARFDDFNKRVQKIAFTDSVHSFTASVPSKAKTFLIKKSINWVCSELPLNVEMDSSPRDVPCRSAGTQKHVETSWLSFDPIFNYFSEP